MGALVEVDMRTAETIIIGAGAAGAVIASRMTENTEREVLLLESGPDYPDPKRLPDDLANGRVNSLVHHDWKLTHRPTQQAFGRFPFPRGRVVGGSSAVNTCIALRGGPQDYDEWAALGLNEWSWDHCLPAFKRLENDHDFSDEWHSQEGPLPIRRHPTDELTEWQQAFLEACKLTGYAACEDSNNPNQTGYGPHAMNRIDGRRISAAEAWLTPTVRQRPGLRIQGHTHVHRVLFDGRQATGVEVTYQGERHIYRAKQVVVCAGAIHTPGVLLRSGVGPKADLDRLGVTCVSDNPAVGAQLLDHPGVAFFMLPKWGNTHRHAPLIQAVCRYQSFDSNQPNDMILQPGNLVPLPWFNSPLVSMMAAMGKPHGVGQMRWTSLAPFAQPTLIQNFLEDESDLARAIEGLQRGFELVECAPMRERVRHIWPGRKTLMSKDRMAQWIRKSCDSGYHPSGTVPMGADGQGATDGRGRVRGVTGLIVADASLMPTIPSSNTHLPTLMIGERFGEWLQAEPGQ